MRREKSESGPAKIYSIFFENKSIPSKQLHERTMAAIQSSSVWSDRDHAVVPWISLRGSSSAAPSINISTDAINATDHDDGSAVTLKIHDASMITQQQQRPPQQYQHPLHRSQQQSCKILSLLSTRERVGTRSSAFAATSSGAVSRVGWLYEGKNVTTASLAKSGAW